MTRISWEKVAVYAATLTFCLLVWWGIVRGMLALVELTRRMI